VKLPLAISLPHAGLRVPPEAAPHCVLTPEQIAADGDEQAAEIYAIESQVAAFVTSDVARAIVDLNRAEDDRSKDGVVKTHTCWDVPVYHTFPAEEVIEALLERYHRPYHARLSRLATDEVRLAIDCHTMAAHGPPVGPDPGAERPRVCLSNADGTCPQAWIEALAECFERAFDAPASINEPFTGGYITRRHAAEMPWVQLELSRAPFVPPAAKRECVLAALRDWCLAFG
jgi:formiminoglutamase